LFQTNNLEADSLDRLLAGQIELLSNGQTPQHDNR